MENIKNKLDSENILSSEDLENLFFWLTSNNYFIIQKPAACSCKKFFPVCVNCSRRCLGCFKIFGQNSEINNNGQPVRIAGDVCNGCLADNNHQNIQNKSESESSGSDSDLSENFEQLDIPKNNNIFSSKKNNEPESESDSDSDSPKNTIINYQNNILSDNNNNQAESDSESDSPKNIQNNNLSPINIQDNNLPDNNNNSAESDSDSGSQDKLNQNNILPDNNNNQAESDSDSDTGSQEIPNQNNKLPDKNIQTNSDSGSDGDSPN